MPDLRRTRKDLKIALAVMAAVDVLAAILYFSPLVGSAESRHEQLTQLQADLAIKSQQVAPLKDLPQKVVLANKQIADFYKTRFATQNSQVGMELGKLTSATGVRIQQVRYKNAQEGPVNGLQAMEVEADLAGNYSSLAHFINAMERDEMFFIIDSVTLGNDPQGPVKLSLRMETYLKVGM